jgi:hypothetical protein
MEYGLSCKRHNSGNLPTRLLYVGDASGLKLVLGEDIICEKYVALSHCWGNLRKGEVPPYCTTRKNINKRKTGSEFDKLPLTFQDAIKVVRGLNLEYLWIDSLCIIQGEDGDWEEESKTMKDVYASAYCTIAAASAIDSQAGFLARNIDSIFVRDDSDRRVYVGTDIADFDNEVEQAYLNTRAWVMQERFLSCRTIHFGKSQMYWECGEGVYCENLTQLRKEVLNLYLCTYLF